MKAYLLNLWDALRASYWFVPTLFAAGALLLSAVMPIVDAAILRSGAELPESILTTTETARATLSAMAGAMVAVTGTVFSITIVTLSMTSQQFGPRLLRQFMYDLPTKLTVGVFLSTGFYCLLLLRVVEHHEDGAVAPHLSVVTAVLLAVLSMAMLIVFIHHVATLIQAPHVVTGVARDLDDAIERLFPERIGQSVSAQRADDAAARDQEARLGDHSIVIRSTREGYVQAIDGDGLLHVACRRDLVLRLRFRPGDFIGIGSPLADVWFAGAQAQEELRVEDLAPSINETVIVGVRRTPRQDVECAIEELVEVAVRSLSPGINDPFTVINCIDRLGATLGRLAERELPSAYRSDDDHRLRLVARPVSFPDLLGAAFNQIRQYGCRSVAVTMRLLEALASIAQRVQRREDRASIKLHAEMIVRVGESFREEHDKHELRKRFERVMRLIRQGPISVPGRA